MLFLPPLSRSSKFSKAFPWVLLAAAMAVLYGPALGRYFVSEDFLILRRLGSGPFLQTVLENFTGPLLGAGFIPFYRPITGFLLQLEWLAFGARPGGYLLAHLLIHGLNTWLAYRLTQSWWEQLANSRANQQDRHTRAVPLGAAAVFSLYPLHPNTVIFIGSAAPLFCTTFLLGALLCFQRYRADPTRMCLGGVLGLFLLALGCYEQAVVLPGLVLAVDLLTPAAKNFTARRRFGFYGSLVLIGIIYFVIRQNALGQVIGGYPGLLEKFFSDGLLGLVASILVSEGYLLFPFYQWSMSHGWLVAQAGFVVAGAWAAGRADWIRLRLWALGPVWILITQAPFAFAVVVPGNGRYWYLTSLGLGWWWMVTWASLLGWAVPKRRAANALMWGVVFVTSAVYGLLLHRNVQVHQQASEGARTLQTRLLELHRSGEEQIFVTGYPNFLEEPEGVPAAQIFHWGLSDALRPPFVEEGPRVYPLNGVSGAYLHPLLEPPAVGSLWRWQTESETLERLPIRKAPASKIFEVGEVLHGEDTLKVLYRFSGDVQEPGAVRLVLVTCGNSSFWPDRSGQPSASAMEEWMEIEISQAVLTSMQEIYECPIYAWLEFLDDRGRPLAVSRRLEF